MDSSSRVASYTSLCILNFSSSFLTMESLPMAGSRLRRNNSSSSEDGCVGGGGGTTGSFVRASINCLSNGDNGEAFRFRPGLHGVVPAFSSEACSAGGRAI